MNEYIHYDSYTSQMLYPRFLRVTYLYFYNVHIKQWTVTKYVDGIQNNESSYFNNKEELKSWYPQFKFEKFGGK